jgi:RNA methyltransferase, TrmH family
MADEPIFGHAPLTVAPTLALIHRLQADRHTRDSRGLFFVEGVRNFVAAVDHGVPVEAIVSSERLLTAPLARKLVRQLKRAGVPYVRLSPEQFRSVSRTKRASGVGAILRQQHTTLASLAPPSQGCWIALRHVRAPGNLGTLIRTAAAVGAAGFFFVGNQIDPYDPAVVRASMGALFVQTLTRASLPELKTWARQHRVQVVGASPDGSALYTDVRYEARTILLLGEERAGLTADERTLCDQLVRIPMAVGTDSLNVGVAGSLLLYEVARARGLRE